MYTTTGEPWIYVISCDVRSYIISDFGLGNGLIYFNPYEDG